jgi:hypothetical protein
LVVDVDAVVEFQVEAKAIQEAVYHQPSSNHQKSSRDCRETTTRFYLDLSGLFEKVFSGQLQVKSVLPLVPFLLC